MKSSVVRNRLHVRSCTVKTQKEDLEVLLVEQLQQALLRPAIPRRSDAHGRVLLLARDLDATSREEDPKRRYDRRISQNSARNVHISKKCSEFL